MIAKDLKTENEVSNLFNEVEKETKEEISKNTKSLE